VLRTVVLTQYRRVTDGQIDGIAIASTALALRALRRAVKTKLRLALQVSQLRRSRLKSTTVNPGQCTQSAPDFMQMGSLSAEFISECVNTIKTDCEVFQVFG